MDAGSEEGRKKRDDGSDRRERGEIQEEHIEKVMLCKCVRLSFQEDPIHHTFAQEFDMSPEEENRPKRLSNLGVLQESPHYLQLFIYCLNLKLDI